MNIDELPVSDEVKAALAGYQLDAVSIVSEPVYSMGMLVRTGEARVIGEATRKVDGGMLIMQFRAAFIEPKPRTPRETLEAWPHGYGTSRLPGDALGDPPRCTVRLYDDRGNTEWYTAEHPTEEAAIAEAAAWCRGNRP